MNHPVSIDVLHKLLRLNGSTGQLFWKERDPSWFPRGRHGQEATCKWWNGRFAGKEAFTAHDTHGHRQGSIFGRLYAAHRVVFALSYGHWPEMVDHIDGDRSNNAVSNLRAASRAENMRNRGSIGRSSRYCGVSWDSYAKKWRARCARADGTTAHLGKYSSERDAAIAYDKAAAKAHGDFAKLNFPEVQHG